MRLSISLSLKPKDDRALVGMQAIADYLGVSRPTIIRWISELGMPVIYRGRGYKRKTITTKFTIIQWIMSMAVQSKYPIGGLIRKDVYAKAIAVTVEEAERCARVGRRISQDG